MSLPEPGKPTALPAVEAAESSALNVAGHAAITSRAEDRLNRREFAETLGKALTGWNQDRSLTVGLYGPWGSGKTSVLNMAVEWIEKDSPTPKPTILRFNPWEWSSQEALFRAFFDELGKKLAEVSGGKSVDLWNEYADRLQVYSTAVQGVFGVVTPAQGLALAGLGLIGGSAVSEGGKSVALVAGLLLLVPSIYKAVVDTRLQLVAFREKKLAKEGKSTLHDAKEKLRQLLRDLSTNLVVVIDDVDRLTPEQMAVMFQLIKANADFPRLTYLLAFQRDTVENGLKEARKVSGAEYLEKIIQVPRDVPHPDPTLIQKELDDGLRAMLIRSRLQKEFDWDRWTRLFDSSARPFFETLRHVARYLDAVSFQSAVLSVRGAIEVDVTDLAGLEVLRVFVPEVYAAVGRNKTLFSGAELHQSESLPKRERIEELIAYLPPNRRAAVLELLKQLFPVVEEAYGPVDRPLPLHAFSYADRRVCNAEVFERYFLLTVPAGDISHSEIERVAEGIEDEQLFREALLHHQEQGTLKRLIERVFFNEWRHSEADLASVIPLMDIADGQPRGRAAPESAFGAIDRLIGDWYRNVGRGRPDLIAQAVERSVALVLPTYLTSWAIRNAIEKEREAGQAAGDTAEVGTILRQVLAGDLGRCARRCVERIEQAAALGALKERRELFELLRAWAEWGDVESVRTWVYANTGTPEEFLKLLRSFWFVTNRPADTPGWEFIVELNRLFPPGMLISRLSEVATHDLDPQDRIVVQECRQGIREASERGSLQPNPGETEDGPRGET